MSSLANLPCPTPRNGLVGPKVGLAALFLVGVLLGSWPHVLDWWELRRSAEIPDSDALLYLAWSHSAVAEGGWNLTDAVHQPSGPMMHPKLLFVPPALLSRISGLSLGLIWRVIGGGGIALALYASIRPVMKSPWTAIGLALFLLCDPGFLFGQWIQREVEIVVALLHGDDRMFSSVPRFLPHLRVPTPAWPIVVLLVHLAGILQARKTGRSRATLVAAVAFGLLFHTFFYFWTAVGLALVLAFLLDREGRKLYFRVALIGGLIGLPAVWEGFQVRGDTPADWLLRTAKFLPIPRFSELLFPKILVVEWLLLAPLAFRTGRERLYPWCLTGAGLLWANHQVLTGLQIENFHWTHAYGVAFSVSAAVLLGPWLEERVERSTWRRCALIGALIGQVVLAFGLRTLETNRSHETLHFRELAQVCRQELDGRMEAGSVVAGDPEATFLEAAEAGIRPLSGRLVEYSALATDDELDARLVLNLYLSGETIEQARGAVSQPAGTWGQEALATRDHNAADRQKARRLGWVDKVWADPDRWIDFYQVEYLLLRADKSPPDRSISRIEPIATGRPTWKLWKIRPKP